MGKPGNKRHFIRIRLGVFDLLVSALSFSIVLLIGSVGNLPTGNEKRLRIDNNGTVYLYNITKDQTIHLQGAIGQSIISIENGTVHFVDSACRDKLCVHKGPFSHAGEWSACMPNRLIATIELSEHEPENPDGKAALDTVSW